METARIITVRISQWSQFFELALNMKYREWFFRGQEDASWLLKTALERDVDAARNGMFGGMDVLTDEDAEQRAIKYFEGIADSELSKDAGAIEVLSVMQHYGTKTRLLDFTFSAFKALYFAFENTVKRSERAIFAISRFALIANSPAIMATLERRFNEEISCDLDDLDRTDKEWQNYFNRFCEDDLFQVDIFKEIVDAHMAGVDHFENDVIPVVLEHVNPRMRAQDGLFLLPLTFGPFCQNLAAVFKDGNVDLGDFKTWREEDVAHVIPDLSNVGMIRMVFDGGLVATSQQVLAQANVFPHTVYPDLVGMARGVRCWRT